MPAATATQKELVRLLVIQHGLRKASEISGVDYDLVRQWESRRIRKERAVTNVTNPVKVAADNVASQLAEHERKTKLGLAKYASDKAAQLAENGKLTDSGHFKNVAGGASIVHRWDTKEQSQGNVIVNIALLGVDPGTVSVAPTLDVETQDLTSEGQDSQG